MKRKSVNVKFSGDHDVIQHIASINESKKDLRSKAKSGDIQSLLQSTFGPSNGIKNEHDCDEPNTEEFKPSKALPEDNGITGGDIFNFQSPRRNRLKDKMVEILSTTPTSNKKSKSKPNTPKSAKKGDKKVSTATPCSKKLRNKRIETTTPHRLRTRNKEQQYNDLSSDDSISSNDSTDDEEDFNFQHLDEEESEKKQKSRPVMDYQEDASNYFHSQDMCITSDRTLARLEVPRMDQEMLHKAMSRYQTPYQSQRKQLKQKYHQMFNKWMFQICTGYNILLHGLGSKHSLMTDFCEQKLSNIHHLVVNGYFPSITVKHILNLITEDFLEHSTSFSNPIDQCLFIKKHFESGDSEDLILVIHNIDGGMLRTEKAQTVLSQLASIQGIHIIASIDHINAPLIWDQRKLSNFMWLWYDVSTFEAYTVETSYENSLLVQQSSKLALSSITHVIQSLTSNARSIFQTLIDYQLDNSTEHNYQGIPFPELYQKCRESFLVNSDQTLKAQLTEFKDHKLLRTKKGFDGIEYLFIPLDSATLKEFTNLDLQSS